MDFLDNFLNRITMYKLVLYYLVVIVGVAAIFGGFEILPYGFFPVVFSALFLTVVCWLVNWIFSKVFEVPANFESAYISALILALIITPAKSLHDYVFLFWAASLAMASKYILALYKKHIFNPVAFAVVITALFIGQSASWWVGTAALLPFVLVGGFLVVRKIQRFDLVFYFIFTALLASFTWAFFEGSSVMIVGRQALLDTPLFFFASIMLTEPLTTPPTDTLQIWYGVIVGVLFAPQTHFGSLYFTPELALLAGNIFSYIVSPKQKLLLRLKEKIKLSPDVYNFVFQANAKMAFAPGQYLEWTLGHKNPDSRGNRRYFTVASSPTEPEITMGVKFYQPPSSFKKSLLAMNAGDKLLAGQLAGDFILPKDKNQKLVFIAGGIGITPFRSMVKYLLDAKEKRDITIFYANKKAEDIIYKDIFDRAQNELGIKTLYTLTHEKSGNGNWQGESGYIDEKMIQQKVPDYAQRTFYVSGPKSMTDSFQKTLHNLGVKHHQIKIDFFPGFA